MTSTTPIKVQSATPPALSAQRSSWVPAVLIGVAIGYLGLVLFLPALNVFIQAFHKGIGPFLENLTRPDFQNAVRLTLLLALIAVPLNTVFGLCAAWALAVSVFGAVRCS
jgi:sulfate/thiosulfate transport system permease protein